MANILNPPPKGAYVEVGGVWEPLNSADPQAAPPNLPFTPPPAGLYTFNASLGQWVPWSGSSGGGAPTGPAGGDLAGTYPNPTVAGINGAVLPINAASLATNAAGQIIVGSGGGGGAPSGPAGGDLAGTYPNPNVAGSSIPTNFSAPGAASTPGMTISGAPFAGGTGTTTVPLVYLNSGATAPTTWSTAGTPLGINAPAGFTGNYLDFRLNGAASVFSVNFAGSILLGPVTISSFQGFAVNNSGANNYILGPTSLRMVNASGLAWTAGQPSGSSIDTSLYRVSPGIVQLGSGVTANNTGQLNLGSLQIIGGTPAASVSQLYCNAAPFTAGTGTTNFPVALFDSGAVDPTTWSTTGTVLGMNTPAGFTGNFIDCRVNGAASAFSLNVAGSMVFSGALSLTVGGAQGMMWFQGFGFMFQVAAAATVLCWTNGTTGGARDTVLNRASAGVLQINSGTAGGSTGSLKLAHVLGGSTTPTFAGGPGAGAAPTIVIAGSDASGSISVTTDAAPTASAGIVTLTFSAPYPAVPFLTLQPTSAAAAALTGAGAVYITKTATGFTVNAGATALAGTTAYTWDYHVIG